MLNKTELSDESTIARSSRPGLGMLMVYTLSSPGTSPEVCDIIAYPGRLRALVSKICIELINEVSAHFCKPEDLICGGDCLRKWMFFLHQIYQLSVGRGYRSSIPEKYMSFFGDGSIMSFGSCVCY